MILVRAGGPGRSMAQMGGPRPRGGPPMGGDPMRMNGNGLAFGFDGFGGGLSVISAKFVAHM